MAGQVARTTGVMSKKAVGALRSESSSRLWILRAATSEESWTLSDLITAVTACPIPKKMYIVRKYIVTLVSGQSHGGGGGGGARSTPQAMRAAALEESCTTTVCPTSSFIVRPVTMCWLSDAIVSAVA